MWTKVFVKEIFSFQLLARYGLALLLWLIIFEKSDVNLVVTTKEVTVFTIALTCMTTYYIAFSLLKFEKLKQYISFPVNSLSFILSLSIAIYMWLLATKYSLLIGLLVISNCNVNFMYILFVAFVISQWSLMLIFEFKQVLLVLTMVISIIIFTGLELIINVMAINLIIYLLVQAGLLLYFNKTRLSHITRLNSPPKTKFFIFNNYFVRMVLSEKILLINSAMTVIAAIIFISSAPHNSLLVAISFTIVGLNAGLSTLLSAQPETAEQTKSLPNNFFVHQYLIFVCSYYLFVNAIIALTLYFAWFDNLPLLILLTVVLSIVETGQTTFLELKYPIRHWKVKADLWRHNRKYLVPITVFIVANLLLLPFV